MKRPRLKPESSGGLYFNAPTSTSVKFFSSGCKVLDCVLGGGWAEGRTINVVGDSSAGKCIRDAYIQTERGLVKIDDLAEDRPEGQTPLGVLVGLRNGEKSLASHFHREVVRHTYHIQTRHGYKLEGTENHPIMVWKPDCSFEMVSLKDLRIGDVSVIAKKSSIGSTNFPIDKSKAFSGESFAKKVELPDFMNKAFASFLGLFVADGNPGGNSLEFSNCAPWFEKELRRVVGFFGLETIKRPKREGTLSQGFAVFSVKLVRLVNYMLGGAFDRSFTARFKFVPDCILQSTLPVQRAFLKSLISCDSEFSRGISYCTASEQLANQVHLMLLNFGIVANHSIKRGPKGYEDHFYHYVSMYGKQANKYLESIGTLGVEVTNPTSVAKSDFDCIPYLNEFLKVEVLRLKQKLGWAKNGKIKGGGWFPHFQIGSLNVSWDFFDKFIDAFSNYPETTKKVRLLKRLDYHFDPIVRIEVRDEPVEVFDVCVPDNHLFWSNGFISHNTQLAIEGCANFARKYTTDEARIRYNENEDAFDNDYAESIGMPLDRVQFASAEKPVSTIEALFEDLELFCDDIEGVVFVKKKDDLRITKPIKGRKKLKAGLYIQDSLDALVDMAEKGRDFGEATYGMSKPKLMSELFRRITTRLARLNVTFMIISQTRDNIGVSFGEKYTRTGGKALQFYCSQVLWLSNIGKIPITKNGVTRTIGTMTRARLKKSKVGLAHRECDFPIRFNYGIDDMAAGINWLLQTKRAKLFGISDESDKKEYLKALDKKPAAEIQKERLKLNRIIEEQWLEVEQQFLPKSKKYA
jgi:RecA/RadA recombinase